MKLKLYNALLILTSLAGYLEWGGNNRIFLFQGEIDIISKLFHDPGSVAHPFILLPMFGQLLLLFTLFQRTPGKMVTYIGMGGIGVLLLFMFIISLISGSFKTLISTIPFLIVAVLTIKSLQGRN